MDGQELYNLYEAYLGVVENQQLDEGEGSYGQTPQSVRRWSRATTSRMGTPQYAKYRGYNQRSIEHQHDASIGPGKKSSRGVGGRLGWKMTQKDRDDARGEAEYGHTGYDPEYDGGPSAPGGKPKGKKLERQKKTGVSAESFDIYDIILSHLLDEGYAETPEEAEVIMVNMSEEWRDDIVEENMKKSPRNVEKTKQKAKERKDRRLRIQYYGKDAVGHGTGEHLRPS